jgi:hypothetical protein
VKFPIVAQREYLGAFCTDSAARAGGLLAIGLKPPPRVQSLGASLRVGERDGARCRLRVGFGSVRSLRFCGVRWPPLCGEHAALG